MGVSSLPKTVTRQRSDCDLNPGPSVPSVHTHHASVHQAEKLVAALLRVVRVTASLAESNGSLPPGL